MSTTILTSAISRRGLALARGAWLLAAALAAVTLAASIPAYIRTVGIVTESEQVAARFFGEARLFSPSPPFEFWVDCAYNALSFGAASLALGLAALIFWRRSSESIALAVSVMLLAYGVVMAGPLEMLVGQRVGGESVALSAQMLLWAAMLFLFCIFPDGRFVPAWTRWFAVLLLPWGLGLAFLEAFSPTQATVGPWLLLYTLPSLVAPYAQVYRYRHVSDAVRRQQTKWVVLGLTAWIVASTAVSGLLLLLAIRFAATGAAASPWSAMLVFAGRLLWPASLTLLPTTLAIAVLKFRLWDIDLLLKRALVYGSLTTLLAVAFFGSVIVLQGAVRLLTGQVEAPLATILSTLAIAALFSPLRTRLQAFVDRRFYRRKYDAARTLAAFGAGARSSLDLDDLSARLLAAVDETMQPAHVSLWLRSTRDIAPGRGEASGT